MPDIEKVIKGLEWCMNEKHDCYREKGCPYENEGEDIGCKYALHSDALALLKAQEPVKPYGMYSEHMETKWLACGACNQPMVKMTPDAVYPNYCPECGRAVKWE